MIRYHPVWAERRERERGKKDLCVEKKRLIRPPTPPDTPTQAPTPGTNRRNAKYKPRFRLITRARVLTTRCTRRDLRPVLEVRRDRDEERRLAELAVHGQRVGASRVRVRVRVRVRARVRVRG